MKEKIIIAIMLFLLGFLMVCISIYKPINILHNTERVEQITIYNISSQESVKIIDKDEIDMYVNELENIKFKKYKLVGNSSIKGLIIILYDEKGNTIDTLYASEKELVYHHWLVNIIDGINPYKRLILKFYE